MIWLIGSEAVKYHLKGDMYRGCSDIDLMMNRDNLDQTIHMLNFYKIEYDLTESKQYPGKFKLTARYPCGKSERFEIDCTENDSRVFLTDDFHFVRNNRTTMSSPAGQIFMHFVHVPSLPMLHAIKMSHAGCPVHTDKTLLDLIKLGSIVYGDMPADFLELNQDEMKLYEFLKAEANERNAVRNKRINFNVPAEQFFKQSEKFRTYTHDLIHDVTCRWDDLGPLFRHNLKNPTKALIDMKVFRERPLEYQLTMIQEEAKVIGIEREFMNNRSLPAHIVYKRGLTKLVRDLSKGEFQQIMIKNMHLLKKPKWDFLERFLDAEQKGLFNET